MKVYQNITIMCNGCGTQEAPLTKIGDQQVSVAEFLAARVALGWKIDMLSRVTRAMCPVCAEHEPHGAAQTWCDKCGDIRGELDPVTRSEQEQTR